MGVNTKIKMSFYKREIPNIVGEITNCNIQQYILVNKVHKPAIMIHNAKCYF